MLKKLVFFIIVLTSTNSRICLAQSKQDSVRHYNNAIYFELGGPALAYSLGYERTWYQNNWFSAISSVGFSYIPDGITMGYIEPDVLFRDKNLAFEMGMALMSYREQSDYGTQVSRMRTLTARVGARFFTKNQRLHFRTGITPNIEIWNNDPKGWPQDRRIFFWLNVFTVAYRF